MDDNEYDSIIRSLVAMMVHQESINDDLRTAIKALTQNNTRLTGIAEDIKTLLARNIPLSENGRET
jgi:hypothetical protein